MLKESKFGIVMTVTVTVVKEVRPRKFVKPSVIVYDVLFRRYCAGIVISLEIRSSELNLFKKFEIVISILAKDELPSVPDRIH